MERVKFRIMYIEYKGHEVYGPARIGRVGFSKTGKTLYYGGQTFVSLKGRGGKSNYKDAQTGEQYWVSGCKKNGADRLYGERLPVIIDADVATEYWTDIRKQPEQSGILVRNY